MIDRGNKPLNLSRDRLALLAAMVKEQGIDTAVGQTIRRRKEGDPLPLSRAQQRLWLLDQLTPGSPVYNIPAAIRLTGPLKPDVLERSVNGIVRRHEVLRMTFPLRQGGPEPAIRADLAISLPVVDLCHLPLAEREAEAQRLAREEGGLPFSLAEGPLLRTTLVRLGEEEHLLLLTLHHIVSDGWSMGVLVRELSEFYRALSAASVVTPPALPIQYSDFAAWQDSWLRGDNLERQMGYWKQKLTAPLPTLELPTDRPRPALRSTRGAVRTVALTAELVTALKDLSRREGSTLYMTLLAAFKVLLYRYTGQEDLLVGSPVAGRTRTELEGLIGCFINTLVLRTDLSGDPSFRELLQRVRRTTMEAYAHQDLPFEQLVEALNPERNLSHTPLFQVLFVLQNTPMPRLELPNLKLDPVEYDQGTAKFDLTLTVEETPTGTTARLTYNTDLFWNATANRILGHLQTLLAAVVEAPETAISRLPILTRQERNQLLEGWNDTAVAYSSGRTLHELFTECAERTPDATALVWEDQQLSYRQLNERANQLAHYLKRLGVAPDSPVALCVERSLDTVVGLLGILKAGGAYVPIDPSYPRERMTYILENTGARLLLTKQRLQEVLPLTQAVQVCLDRDWEQIAREDGGNPELTSSGENLAYVIYTSGSTGAPKGVAVEHRQVLNYVAGLAHRLGLVSGATYALVSTIATDLGNTVLFPALTMGGTLHIVSQERATDAYRLAEYFERHRIDCLKITPSHLAALLTASRPERILPKRWLVLGGEVARRELIKRIEALPHGCTVYNHYGPTETTVGVLTYRLDSALPEGVAALPLGRPLPNSRIYLLDRNQEPVSVGVPGEIYIGGHGVARGYLHRPELTAGRFVRNPFSADPADRLYKTGDLARFLPDGNIEFIGRTDDQVKIRGFRIEPGEVEAVLARHPGVRQVVVAAQPDEAGDKRLVAFVVPQASAGLTQDDLRTFAREYLPLYMIPSVFMLLGALPLMPNGKVDRRSLPVPEKEHQSSREPVAPRNSVEQGIARIWQDLLQAQTVGVNDNFFDLGGHSLLLIQLHSQLRQVFGADISLVDLYEHPNIESQARLISRPTAGTDTLAQSEERALSRRDAVRQQRETRQALRTGRRLSE